MRLKQWTGDGKTRFDMPTTLVRGDRYHAGFLLLLAVLSQMIAQHKVASDPLMSAYFMPWKQCGLEAGRSGMGF